MVQHAMQNTQWELCWCGAYLHTPVTEYVSGIGEGEIEGKRAGGNANWRRGEGVREWSLTTCLASSRDVCSLLISFSYCSLILSTSWSWAATSSFRAPFRAVSSLSRLLSTSSCSSLARRSSCISSFSCIISCGKWRINSFWLLSPSSNLLSLQPFYTVNRTNIYIISPSCLFTDIISAGKCQNYTILQIIELLLGSGFYKCKTQKKSVKQNLDINSLQWWRRGEEVKDFSISKKRERLQFSLCFGEQLQADNKYILYKTSLEQKAHSPLEQRG